MFRNLLLSSYWKDLSTRPVFLVDTCILSDIAKGKDAQRIADFFLAAGGVLAFATPSIFELGFGRSDEADSREIKLCHDMYIRKSAISDEQAITTMASRLLRNDYERYQGKWIGVNPDMNNWFASKLMLVKYMDTRDSRPGNARGLQLDALLASTAWNLHAGLWTNNIRDFALMAFLILGIPFSSLEKTNQARRFLPLFSTYSMEKLLSGAPVNIYEDMLIYVSDEQVKELLKIAAFTAA